MSRFVERALAPLPLPETADAWRARRDALRREVLAVLGLDDLVPPRWSLNVQSKGTLRREGYRIEKLTFESYPGMAVPALLYVPDGVHGRVPGIVSIGGHAYATGKATESIQQRNINLVLRGCVVLAYDYIDTGERNTGPDPMHGKPYGGGNHHGIRSFSFSRRTATALEVLDGIRALDLLVGRPEVEPQRLGFTGESGGGNSTYWVSALDPRVKLALPVSSVTTFDYWIRNDRNWDYHQRPPGIRRIADIGTLLALHAPNPLLVISSKRGTDDEEFPVEEAQKSVAWATHVYKLLSAGDAIRFVESTTDHGYQQDKREQLYAWVEKWLQPPAPKGEADLPVKTETFEALRCGLPKDNPTFHDIFAEWLKPLPRTHAQGSSMPSKATTQPDDAEKAALRRFLRQRLGWPDGLPVLRGDNMGREQEKPWTAEFWLLQSEPGIRMTCILLGRQDGKTPIELVPGRDAQAVARALGRGHQVLAFDPRGSGEMNDGGGPVRNWAWFAGRPWSGMWALDIAKAAQFCKAQYPNSPILIEATNRFGWSALLAAAAAPDLIESGHVTIPFASLHDQYRAQDDYVLADVPGLLERLDVPQLRQLASGVQVQIDPRGTP